MRSLALTAVVLLSGVAFVAAYHLPIFLIFTHQSFRQPGVSMEPAISPGDVVYVDMTYFVANEPKIGDVALFTTTAENGGIGVKRIVAFGGSTVEIRDAALLIDGLIVPEPYLKEGGATTPYSVSWGPFTLPAGCVLLLGDYRDHSKDSRADGCYSAEHLIGLVGYVAPSGSLLTVHALE